MTRYWSVFPMCSFSRRTGGLGVRVRLKELVIIFFGRRVMRYGFWVMRCEVYMKGERERREGKGVYCGGGDLQKFHCQRLIISSIAPMKERM